VPNNARACKTEVDRPSTLKATTSVLPGKSKTTRDVSLRGRQQRALSQTAKGPAQTAKGPAQTAKGPAQTAKAPGGPSETERRAPTAAWPNAVGQSKSTRRRFMISFSPLTFIAMIIAGGGIYWFGYREDPFLVSEDIDPVERRIEEIRNNKSLSQTAAPVESVKNHYMQTAVSQKFSVPQQVTIWLDASPSTVAVMWDGKPLTMRPLVVPYGKEAVQVRFSAPGFQDLVREITPNLEQTIRIQLVAKSAREAGVRRKTR
jgi:hypothetical protein